MSKFEVLNTHVFVTKLAGFEHTKYIQKQQTHNKLNETDIPMVQGKNIRNGFFVENYDWYISKNISDSLERSKLTKECILIPYVGSNLGEVGIFYHPYDCHMASNIAKVELVDDYFELEFLKYYLQSPIGQKYLFQSKQGSSQPNITMEAIRNTKILNFGKEKQNSISNVLKNIDLKIANNNKVNQELESLAKTIYDYWFLQFEFPNEEGKPYKSSGGKMVWNEELKREIPEGWGIESLEHLGELLMGQSPKSESYNDNEIGLPLINGAAELKKESITISKYTSEPTRICKKNDLIFCIRATIGNLRYSEREYCLGRGVASFTPKKRYSEYLYYVIENILEKYKKTLTGSIIVGITKDDLATNCVLIPNSNILSDFSKLIKPIFDKKRINEQANQELESLRDFLLPMLMNGQVTFKEN